MDNISSINSNTSAVAVLANSFAQQPTADYQAMFNNVADPATEPSTGTPAPKVWGSFRLAAWAWAGINDVGPVILPHTPHPYNGPAAQAPVSFIDITVF